MLSCTLRRSSSSSLLSLSNYYSHSLTTTTTTTSTSTSTSTSSLSSSFLTHNSLLGVKRRSPLVPSAPCNAVRTYLSPLQRNFSLSEPQHSLLVRESQHVHRLRRSMGTSLMNITKKKNNWAEVTPPPITPLPEAVPESFAMIHVGGSQYKVMAGDYIMTQKLTGCDIGSEIVLKKVLLVGTKEWTAIGVPILEAKVHATVEEQTLAEKVIIFKMKRRKNYRRFNTSRAPYTLLRITDIVFDYEKYLQDAQTAKEVKLYRPLLNEEGKAERVIEEVKREAMLAERQAIRAEKQAEKKKKKQQQSVEMTEEERIKAREMIRESIEKEKEKLKGKVDDTSEEEQPKERIPKWRRRQKPRKQSKPIKV